MPAAAVLYAMDPAVVSAFYVEVAGLRTVSVERDHVLLATEGFELVVLQVPARVASTLTLADPPVRRESTPVKLAFEVPDLAAARTAAARLGGELNPPAREWTYRNHRVCDGHDPEGNVLQLRQPKPAEAS